MDLSQPAELLSLDVEGSEGSVLASMPRLASTFKWLVVEDGGIDHSPRGQRVWRVLDRLKRAGMQEQTQYSVRNSRIFASPAALMKPDSLHDSLSPPALVLAHPPFAKGQPSTISNGGGTVSHGARTPPSHASTECVRRHAGMAETLILPSVLHVASDRSEHRVSPNADTLLGGDMRAPAGTFVEVIDPLQTDVSQMPPSTTFALERCFGWRGVRLSLAAQPAGSANMNKSRAPRDGQPTLPIATMVLDPLLPATTLSNVASSANLGDRIDFVALNTDHVLSFLQDDDSSAGVSVHSLLIHWRGHKDDPTSTWTRCVACRATSGFRNDTADTTKAKHGVKLLYDRRLSQRHNEIRFFVQRNTCWSTPSPGGRSCFGEACQLHPRWGTSVCRGNKAHSYCPAVRKTCANQLIHHDRS